MVATESILYSFAGGNDGAQAWAGVIFDGRQAICMAPPTGAAHPMRVLSTNCHRHRNQAVRWTETVLYSFAGGDDGPGAQSD